MQVLFDGWGSDTTSVRVVSDEAGVLTPSPTCQSTAALTELTTTECKKR